MKPRLRRILSKRQRRLARRHDAAIQYPDTSGPVITTPRTTFDISERVEATSWAGVATALHVVDHAGLRVEIDQALNLLQIHRPYHESDHVLNIALNALVGGSTLDDIRLRRDDEAFLNMIGASSLPAPTTAGDFCRRFNQRTIHVLMDAINRARLRVWQNMPQEWFRQTARIDVDGTLVSTTGECKEGMDISRKGTWGYHPLLVSVANTGEPLFIVNRSGNRPSHEGAASYLDRAIELCRRAGFKDVLLRGDTDFSQVRHLDRWNAQDVRFVFGYKAHPNLKACADGIESKAWHELIRKAEQIFDHQDKISRRKQPRVKEAIVKARGFKNLRLRSEDLAEFEYTPGGCRQAYRMVVLRKNISVEKGEQVLFDEVRYFFYITNDFEISRAAVVYESNQRCNQENLIEQLKNGARALHAPVNTLNANWAYMVMASLAWTIKAWMALSVPVSPRWRVRHEREKRIWLRMELKRFRDEVLCVPAQILRSGRRVIVRLLSTRAQTATLLRLHAAL